MKSEVVAEAHLLSLTGSATDGYDASALHQGTRIQRGVCERVVQLTKARVGERRKDDNEPIVWLRELFADGDFRLLGMLAGGARFRPATPYPGAATGPV